MEDISSKTRILKLITSYLTALMLRLKILLIVYRLNNFM